MTISIGVGLTAPHSLPLSAPVIVIPYVGCSSSSISSSTWCPEDRQTDRPTMGLTGKSNASLQAPPPSRDLMMIKSPALSLADVVWAFLIAPSAAAASAAAASFVSPSLLSAYVSLLSVSSPSPPRRKYRRQWVVYISSFQLILFSRIHLLWRRVGPDPTSVHNLHVT